MPLTLTFSAPLNVSCQVGDTAYMVDTTTSGGFTTHTGNITKLGIISGIGGTQSAPTITIANNVVTVTGSKFILFSKDNKANLSSVLGYYAEVKFKTNSTSDNELFSIGADIFESSK